MPTQVATSRDVVTINVVPEFTGKVPNQSTKLFIDQYLIDFNAAQAAVRIGKTKRWSESHGARLLRDNAAYVSWLQRIRAVENAAHIAMSQDEIFDEMELFARANIQDYFTIETKDELVPSNAKKAKPQFKKVKVVRWKQPDELTRKQAAAVKRVVLDSSGAVKDYVLYDKDASLVSLGRHLGMFSEKVILEHRHKHLHAKADFSKMPLEKLLEMEQEFLPYLPESMKEAR